MIYKTKIIYVIVLLLLLFSCTFKVPEYGLLNKGNIHQTLKVKSIENGKEVTKTVERIKLDTLENIELNQVNDFLSTIRPLYMVSKDFMFIKYYPGKDRNNSTGIATRDDIGENDKIFISELKGKESITCTWVYKNKEGLERFSKIPQWIFDQNQIIESAFFEYHYPGSSYIILHKSGIYYAYYGESSFRQQLEDIDLFIDLFKQG